MPATPEANSQAVLTDVNTLAEDKAPVPREAPNVPGEDESPDATPAENEVKGPTISEEDESPPTTTKVPTATEESNEVRVPPIKFPTEVEVATGTSLPLLAEPP